MKLLFVNAIDISRPIERRYPPLGIGYLCSYLRARYPLDKIECRVVEGNIEREILEFKPDIVGISAVTQNYNMAVACAAIAKKRGIAVICGGIHISMMPMSLATDMDVGVIGEGEETLCELYGLFRAERKFPKEALKNVKGVAYWNEPGTVAMTEPRSQITELDTIPFPDRDLFVAGEETYIFSSRGCPYSCRFCASTRFWKRIRFFSADYVVREIENLYTRRQVTKINFYDDLFCADITRMKRIVDLLEQKGLLGKIEFIGALRANIVTGEAGALLKKMGFSAIGIGLESGCDETLAYLKGEGINNNDNRTAIDVLTGSGIKVLGSFIIGSPNETKADILKTYAFIKNNDLAGFNIYILTPFPGTAVWDYAVSRNLVSEDMDWSRLSIDFEHHHHLAVILSEKVSRNELYRLYMKFIRYRKVVERKKRILNIWKDITGIMRSFSKRHKDGEER